MSLNAHRTSYVSARNIQKARGILRREKSELQYDLVLRAGDPGPGVFVATIIDRAKARGERPDDYEAAIILACICR
jgi:hypothetical protein